MSEKKPIFTLVKMGSAYESRHRTPEREEEMEIERMFSRHKTPERETEPESPPMFTLPTARLRKHLQNSIQPLVIDAKDNKFMGRTTVSFWRRQNFHPAFMLTPSIFCPRQSDSGSRKRCNSVRLRNCRWRHGSTTHLFHRSI